MFPAPFSGVLPDIPVTGGDAHETGPLAPGLATCSHLTCLRLLAESVPHHLAAIALTIYGTVGIGAQQHC